MITTAALLGAAAVFAVLALVVPDGRDADGGKASREEVAAFHDSLVPLAQEWGRIEVQGMRPAIGQLQRGEGVPPETIAGEAKAWQSGLVDLRRRISALAAPDELAEAARLFDQAMTRYVEAAAAFERAAAGPAEGRQERIDAGIAVVTDGARLYNEASMLLQASRRRVGLPVSTDFPNHPAAPEQ